LVPQIATGGLAAISLAHCSAAATIASCVSNTSFTSP
jgi:hypothetical protein